MSPDPHEVKDYRPDIDGLRALAVLSAIAFHAFPEKIKGGYIGVDIFFVISGFLITRILLESLREGSFSIRDFYRRRVARIFPALLLVLSACYAIGWFVLLGPEYTQLGKHIAGGAGFVANFVLWGESGYFDVAAETKPLLHLWSLGIEEQFYIVWPLTLALAWKFRRDPVVVTACVALLSFLLNLNSIRQDPTGTFYSPHTRIWELLCGALLAGLVLRAGQISAHPSHGAWQAIARLQAGQRGLLPNLLSLAGALLLIVGFARLSKTHLFPGVWALLPVAGSMLLILAGPAAWINRRLLSSRLAIWFGLVSYPLYLWHWPLLSFARIVAGETPKPLVQIGLLLAAVVLAGLTYRWVELPLRYGWRSKHKTTVLMLCMSTLAGLGYLTFKTEGLAFRIGAPEPTVSRQQIELAINPAIGHCAAHFPEWGRLTDAKCRMQKNAGNTIAVIGDSHAGHLFVGLASHLASHSAGEDAVAVFPASCAAPFIDISSAAKDPRASHIRKDAYKLINSAYEYVIRDPDIRTVLLAHNPMCSGDDAKDISNPAKTDIAAILRDGMARSVEALLRANKEVILLFDSPFLPYEPAQCAKRPFMSGPNTEKCAFERARFDSLMPFVRYRSIVAEVQKMHPDLRTYDLADLFCNATHCVIQKDGRLLFSDNNHLTTEGSLYVAPHLIEAIRGARRVHSDRAGPLQ